MTACLQDVERTCRIISIPAVRSARGRPATHSSSDGRQHQLGQHCVGDAPLLQTRPVIVTGVHGHDEVERGHQEHARPNRYRQSGAQYDRSANGDLAETNASQPRSSIVTTGVVDCRNQACGTTLPYPARHRRRAPSGQLATDRERTCAGPRRRAPRPAGKEVPGPSGSNSAWRA